jgi:hypothetical protein
MSDGPKGDSTVQDIVVALRDTARRRAGDMASTGAATGEGRSDLERDNARGRPQRVDSLHKAWRGESVADMGVTELRDAEIERLLGENRRLNERVVFLLKVIERDQQVLANERAAAAQLAEGQEIVARETRAALEAEWRPILVTLLRMLDRREQGQEQEQPPARGVRRVFGVAKSDTKLGGRAGRSETDEHGYDPGWILDLIRSADRSDRPPDVRAHHMRNESESVTDEREASFFVRFFTRITHFR